MASRAELLTRAENLALSFVGVGRLEALSLGVAVVCSGYGGKGKLSTQTSHITRVTISMVSLKWGEVLSTLLPGAVAVFALSPYIPQLGNWFQRIDQIGPSFALLMTSALAGGGLEAITRITWERWLTSRRTTNIDVLDVLTPANVELYERGVQSSYKYVTFYANFAWALSLVFLSAVWHDFRTFWPVLLLGLIGILLRASYVQWTYFVNYQNKVFGEKPKP